MANINRAFANSVIAHRHAHSFVNGSGPPSNRSNEESGFGEGVHRDLFRKIEQAKKEWEVTLDALPQLILLMDQHGRVLRANRTLERWGLGRVVDVKGADLHQLLHPHCQSPVCSLRWLREQVVQGEAGEISYEDAFLGRYVRVEIVPTIREERVARFFPSEPEQRFAVIIHDITERHQAERKLQQANDDLLQALQRRQEMLQNVSHELRTPLTLIQGFAQLLATGALGEMNGEQQDALAVMSEKGQELQRLIERMLLLQRDVKPERMQAQPLSDLIQRSLATWQPQADRKGIRLFLASTPPARQIVSVQAEMMLEVVGNLLENAIKFSPANTVVSVGMRQEAEHVVFFVQDQGIGVPVAFQQQIYEDFYQVDGASTRSAGGIGIGLTLCRRIVHAHQGEIWLESPGEGRGSAFFVRLPLWIENTTSSSTSSLTSSSASS